MSQSIGDIVMALVIQKILESYGPMLGATPADQIAERIVKDLDVEVRCSYEHVAADVVDSVWYTLVDPDSDVIRDRSAAIDDVVFALKDYRIYRLKY